MKTDLRSNNKCGGRRAVSAWLVLVAILLSALPACKQDAPNKRVADLVATIDRKTVTAHMQGLLEIGPRPSNDARATDAAVEYIAERLVAYGFIPEEEAFEARSWWDRDAQAKPTAQRNVIAQVVGTREPGRILEIGAHYDTVPGSPGADDNASGVAALLTIAKALGGRELKRSVRFCFFAMEEDGLVGSRHHVRRLDEIGENVEGVFVLDMIGFRTESPGSQEAPLRVPLLFSPPREGNFLAVLGNFSSGALGNLFEDSADRYVPGLRYFSMNRVGGLLRDSSRSDHAPYWRAGRKAIMITDTANFRNPHYHEPSDTLDTIDLDFLTTGTRAMAATALEWAEVLR